jgi:hypothetical protein
MLPKIKDHTYIRVGSAKIHHFLETEIGEQTDFDVFLVKYGRNLQRDYCWELFQQQELIMSIIMNRHIPPITVVKYSMPYLKEVIMIRGLSDEEIYKPRYQIIDGKQRLLTHKKFIENEFSIEGSDGEKYYFKDLPENYKNHIQGYAYSCCEFIYKYYGDATDDDLVDLFKWCNFAGTLQEKDYMERFV